MSWRFFFFMGETGDSSAPVVAEPVGTDVRYYGPDGPGSYTDKPRVYETSGTRLYEDRVRHYGDAPRRFGI